MIRAYTCKYLLYIYAHISKIYIDKSIYTISIYIYIGRLEGKTGIMFAMVCLKISFAHIRLKPDLSRLDHFGNATGQI